MYKLNPAVTFKEGDFIHPENVYKMEPICPIQVGEAPEMPSNTLDRFLINKASARSKLGQALEAKQSKDQKQNGIQVKSAQQVKFKSVSHAENTNEMLLDKYIVRKTAPVSELGKHLHNVGKQENADSAIIHRLLEIGKKLDSFLSPTVGCTSVSPVISIETAVPPKKPVISKGKSENIAVFTPRVEISPQSSQSFIDLAVHCDPSCPPFALLAYVQMLIFTGRNVSVQFYRHSTLKSVPNYLNALERFFTGRSRSSTSEFILSLIWRPCSFGCMAIGNPFKELPLYGESIILMSLARSSPDFGKVFSNLPLIESAVSSKGRDALSECIKKIGRKGEERLSIDEIYLFCSALQSGLSSDIEKSDKAWFDRCMKNDSLANILKLVKYCH